MSAFPPPGAPRAPSRLVGFGFALVILGWAILAADLALSDAVLKAGSLVAVLTLKSDIVTLAQTLVVSGFGLAVVGALRDGFGALNRFFDAVLQRSSVVRTEPMPQGPMQQGPMQQAPMPQAPMPVIDEEAIAASPDPDRTVPPPRARNYVIRPDGSVEVETLLGTRIFATLDEARGFIR